MSAAKELIAYEIFNGSEFVRGRCLPAYGSAYGDQGLCYCGKTDALQGTEEFQFKSYPRLKQDESGYKIAPCVK